MNLKLSKLTLLSALVLWAATETTDVLAADSALATPPNASNGGFEVTVGPYGPYPENTYSVCRPPPHIKVRVAVILAHGGWWRIGTYDFGAAKIVCQSLAARGILVMSINYRLTVPTGGNPAWAWPAQVQDAERALRQLRKWWPTIPVGIVGTSAGGHIALMAAFDKTRTIWKRTDPRNEASQLVEIQGRPDFVVDISGPTDLTNSAIWQVAITQLLTGLPMTLPRAKAFASPITHVDGSAPPVLVVHGEHDETIPYVDAVALETALTGADVPNKFIRTPGGHVFNGLTTTQIQAYMDQIAAWIFSQPKR